MSIKSQQEQRIKAYIDSNPSSKTDRVQKIEIGGRAIDLFVYRLPIKLLIFNIENGRFAADLSTLEKDLGRNLDTRNPTDARKVKQILLNKYPSETKKLREDLKQVGQLEAGVITAAGVVINANRRMAILSTLYDETSKDKYAYLETVILPRETDETEIYKIEARLQYAKDFRMPFGAVNELLKIREGLGKGMTKSELATLLSRDEKYINEHLAQLSLLEAYSKYAWGKIDYKKIEDLKITEQITDVEKNLRKFKSEGQKPSKIERFLKIQFAYIKAGSSYQDIRAFGKGASIEDADRLYFEAFENLSKKRISEESFKESIDDANETVRRIKKEQKPIELIIRILGQIKGFRDEQHKITPEIKKYLTEISSVINQLKKQ